MPFTIWFYAPQQGDPFPERRDHRVTLSDYDEVTLTHRIEFTDGLRVVVPASSLVSRET